jgi:hypothetical protein
VTRQDIFAEIEKERAYQDQKWGRTFDDKNTPNDWITYIAKYLGQAVTLPFDRTMFRTQILKVMTLCCAVLERDSYAPRHYDKGERI